MAACSNCVIYETTVCVTICVPTSQESKEDPKRGRDGKERQNWRHCEQQFYKCPCHTGHWFSLGIRRALSCCGPSKPPWVDAQRQSEVATQQCGPSREGDPPSPAHIASAFAWLLHGLQPPGLWALHRARAGNKKEWFEMNLQCWSGDLEQRSSRQECPASSLSSDTQTRRLAFTFC